jgi:hypothetical protein
MHFRRTGPESFPQLISGPFHEGLVVVFGVAAAPSVVGALASFIQGRRFVHDDDRPSPARDRVPSTGSGPGATTG